MNYESLFEIGQEVKYQYNEFFSVKEGQIVAIRFTKSKVFYDVLDNESAKIERDIASDFVFDKSYVEQTEPVA